MEKQASPKILVITNNHFDPTWRRCWSERFVDGGKTYVSYSDIEDFYLRDNLELARRIPDYKFEAESAVVLREFLERYPERAEEFKKLAAAGRFSIAAAGDNIIDSNMVLGESIVRNFVSGILWVEKELGLKSVRGVRNDAFGNSAQIPQIFRGCGIKWATGFSYSSVQGSYFKGLDGSTVCAAFLPSAGHPKNACDKYPPCESCDGKGCAACYGRGVKDMRAIPPDELDLKGAGAAACVLLCPEEMAPCKEIGDWVAAMRKKHDIRFAIGDEAYPFLKNLVEAADNPPASALHPEAELNPNNTGCYVARIKLKQECRRLEYSVLGAETLACMARLKGHGYPKAGFEGVWRRLLLTMFHDAITATHIDAAYDELMEMNFHIDYETASLRRRALAKLVEPKANLVSAMNLSGSPFNGVAEATVECDGTSRISLSNSSGKPVRMLSFEEAGHGRAKIRFLTGRMPPLSAKICKIDKGPALPQVKKLSKPVIENARFKVSAAKDGLVSIYDKKLKAEICKESASFKPCEPVLESDEGSPWAVLKDSSARMRASKYELLSAESGPGFQRLSFKLDFGHATFAGGDPLSAVSVVTLHEGVERVDFSVSANWEAFNARLRFAFPVPFKGSDFYEIPYGILKRKPYKPSFSWTGANGDWPAINWAGTQGKSHSVALFNKGLPSYKIESDGKDGKVILLSVLRSPMIPTYLHEPKHYVMTGFWGMRDAGAHSFEFALAAYEGGFAESSVVDDAEAYNAGVLAVQGEARLPETPCMDSPFARISSMKISELGDALVVRVVEFRGMGGEAFMRVPSIVKAVSKTNLLEREGTALERDMTGSVKFRLRPWEIATIRCELA